MDRQVPADVGIGLRQPHHESLLERLPGIEFVEVHAENFFADGGAALAGLRQVRAHYPVSLHCVGLGLGSAAGLDPWHLERLARLAGRIEPRAVSDHACFARAAMGSPTPAVVHANDLLPIAFTDASLELMVAHVTHVQERLGRPLLIENLAQTLGFADDSMSEPEFFASLCRRSGCGMLLDVNNLMVNALNASTGAMPGRALAACRDFIEALPTGIVGEIHVAGYCDRGAIVIDDHGSRVRPAVWEVLGLALQRFGTVPTLVEWDTDLPTLDVLLSEAAHAAALQGIPAVSA